MAEAAGGRRVHGEFVSTFAHRGLAMRYAERGMGERGL